MLTEKEIEEARHSFEEKVFSAFDEAAASSATANYILWILLGVIVSLILCLIVLIFIPFGRWFLLIPVLTGIGFAIDWKIRN
jgi:hypothetical protein